MLCGEKTQIIQYTCEGEDADALRIGLDVQRGALRGGCIKVRLSAAARLINIVMY